MKKLIWAVLLSSGMITLPSHAGEAQFLYQATATNSDSGAPIEGVLFNWTFIDKVSNVTSINTCVTNVDGTCEVKLIAQTGTFSGPNVIGQAVATKDGYDKEVEYQWQQYGNQRFLMARLKAK
ncbi:hypothetical protein SAMN05428948_1129 [Massilia sp. CF038]|nr:hypothetical protein SAMN05428948_1129 [Massilia sp. CF038]